MWRNYFCIRLGGERRKELFDRSGGKTKTGISPNKKRNTGTRYSFTIWNNANYFPKAATVTAKVRIKKPETNNDGFIVVLLPQNIPANKLPRYEEIEALPEPVIESQHQTTSSIREKVYVVVPFLCSLVCHRPLV